MTIELRDDINVIAMQLSLELGRRVYLADALTAMRDLAKQAGPQELARLVPEGRRRQQG